ncbi:MAG: universal stress protein [Actinomycetota bacterium]|nr:universal stress protein [Actinomycetota bacterium]
MTGRRLVLGISGHQTAHLLDWTASVAEPGDQVRIVHAYRPIPYAATDWQLPIDTEAMVLDLTVRHVRDAANRLRRLRPDIQVRDELTGDRAEVMLLDAAAAADLVLVGSPHCDRSRAVLDQVLGSIACPLLVLGAAATHRSGSVTAVLRGDAGDDAVLEVAFTEADRRRGTLLAVKQWWPPLDGSRLSVETAEQQALDTQLEQWQRRRPGVAVIAELLLGDSAARLRDRATDAELLVLNRPGTATIADTLLAELILTRDQPTLVVPRQLVRSTSIGAAPPSERVPVAT